jgi:YidC/Oxa1 family membrane protein insertase
MRKKQQEIMELQQKSGYSPFAGCLPLIIQLIIVGFILYPIIQNPLRYVLNESTDFSNALLTYATAPEAAGGLGLNISAGNVMELLSALNETNIVGVSDFALFANGGEILAEYAELSIPHFSAFGINLGKMPSFTSILILVPLLNVVGQWFTMRLTRKWTGMGYNAMAGADGQDKASIKMMDIVPLLITVFILFKVPAMIGIYWFFRSLVSLGKQFLMQKVMPVPKYTAEEIKEMEKAAKERQKAQKEALKQQPKVRSLHYIDEDDYDELPAAKTPPQVSDTNKKLGGGSAPEIKD